MTKFEMYQEAAYRTEMANLWSCLQLRRLRRESGELLLDEWRDDPVVIEYAGVFDMTPEEFTDAVAAVSKKESQDLRVMLLLFAAEVFRTGAA